MKVNVSNKQKLYRGVNGKKRCFSRLLDHEPRVLPYPYQYGLVELEIPLGRILEPPHPQLSQLSLLIEPYKYKLISIAEGREKNSRVMLLN